MAIKMIVAADQGNSIGWSDGSLPWRIPADLQRFKDLTTGHTVVMGRTTYQSLKRPNGLPNRRNIVLTRSPYSEVRGLFGEVEIINSLDWVVKHKNTIERTARGADQAPSDIWIIGGASVYAEALNLAIVDEIRFTQVHTISGADVTLPFDLYAWKLFVLRQRKLNIIWDPIELEYKDESLGVPATSYLTLKRLQ